MAKRHKQRKSKYIVCAAINLNSKKNMFQNISPERADTYLNTDYVLTN